MDPLNSYGQALIVNYRFKNYLSETLEIWSLFTYGLGEITQ